MEAIDDYANENIIRSVAYSALEKRQQRQYAGLLSISSQLLRQRVHLLGPKDNKNVEEWEQAVQWQQDACPRMIESLWSQGGSVADELYQKPVYYKRLDANTLHAVIEFAELDTKHFVVVLLLEDGSGDVSDIKYYNTKELNEEEWLDIFENWSRSIEDAERIFLTKVTRHKKLFTAGTPDSSRETKDAPEDYWGEWSSDEGSSHDATSLQKSSNVNQDSNKDSDDSEDEYYTRWSKDPGTITPGPTEKTNKGRVYESLSQDEINEEYDNSYNPLFTVPSVPNLMDAHTAALSELTQILQTSLPQQQSLHHPRRTGIQPMTQINPLPKAVSRLKSTTASTTEDEQEQQQQQQAIPGTYPESGTQSPKPATENMDIQSKEAGRGLFMKSLRALIGAAKLLGYEGKDILEMVQEIVNNP